LALVLPVARLDAIATCVWGLEFRGAEVALRELSVWLKLATQK
jgi:hypothetical protein